MGGMQEGEKGFGVGQDDEAIQMKAQKQNQSVKLRKLGGNLNDKLQMAQKADNIASDESYKELLLERGQQDKTREEQLIH